MTVLQFLKNNHTALLLLAGWCFSALVSSMPPLPENAGFWSCWCYHFIQMLAANMPRKSQPSTDAKQKENP